MDELKKAVEEHGESSRWRRIEDQREHTLSEIVASLGEAKGVVTFSGPVIYFRAEGASDWTERFELL